MTSDVTPFAIQIPDDDLDDLRLRLARTRWPDAETTSAPDHDAWDQGLPLAYARALADYWEHEYDWRRAEALLAEMPQFRTELDGPGGALGIHFLHLRSPHEQALPLLLTHGWPGSVLEFHKVMGPLADPQAHGGDAADAFHVICPTLPGFGFSDKPSTPGWGVAAVATAWHQLMKRLGYQRYVAQGGDWGGIVTQQMGVDASGPRGADGLLGIHVNFPIVAPDPATMEDLTVEEQAALAALQYYTDIDTGYNKQQSTRPQTLGYALADSPVGQMAWIVEKFHRWMDCDGDPANAVTRDEMLDEVMMYWLPDAAASSARFYWESVSRLNRDPISIPSGCSVFPGDFMRTSRRWAERRFTDLRHFSVMKRGGHFAALEVPEDFVAEIRAAFRMLR